MTGEKSKTNKEVFDKEDVKILIGEKLITCFACGERIDKNSEICPFCNTKQNIK
ncbi:MAG: hypothetical protein ACTSU4_08675 [Promethearchaeota archaeon]